MAKEQLTPEEKDEFLKLLDEAILEDTSATTDQLSRPDPRSIEPLLKERKWQRWIVFTFAIGSAVVSLILLFGIITIQAYFRIKGNPDFTLLSGYELEILSVSVFGQILGVIYIIAKAIWDDSLKEFYK